MLESRQKLTRAGAFALEKEEEEEKKRRRHRYYRNRTNIQNT